MFKASLEDGKYTYINDNGKQQILRYGFPWKEKELAGDNLLLAMGNEIERLQLELRYVKFLRQIESKGFINKEDFYQYMDLDIEGHRSIGDNCTMKMMVDHFERGQTMKVDNFYTLIKNKENMP